MGGYLFCYIGVCGFVLFVNGGFLGFYLIDCVIVVVCLLLLLGCFECFVFVLFACWLIVFVSLCCVIVWISCLCVCFNDLLDGCVVNCIFKFALVVWLIVVCFILFFCVYVLLVFIVV